MALRGTATQDVCAKMHGMVAASPSFNMWYKIKDVSQTTNF